MSEYGKYTTRKPTPLLSHDSVKEAKAARKKLLEQIEQRRWRIYGKLKTASVLVGENGSDSKYKVAFLLYKGGAYKELTPSSLR